MIPDDVWNDQAQFNRELRRQVGDWENSLEMMKELKLCIDSEMMELLQTMQWKRHRQSTLSAHANRQHQLEECIDVFKLWLTMVQGFGFTREELQETYRAKSMVVRQRLEEEWLMQHDRHVVLVDIDMVLCDYVEGFRQWVQSNYQDQGLTVPEGAGYLDAATLGVKPEQWEQIKHRLRCSYDKARFPIMPGAREFLTSLKRLGYRVALLTSRPFHRYQNLMAATMMWLDQHELPFDYLWWAEDKGEFINLSSLRANIVFAVDDDPRFVSQYAKAGIFTYWVDNGMFHTPVVTGPGHFQRVTSLEEIAQAFLPITSEPKERT